MIPTDVVILRELLAHADEPVSGTRLARRLGITRVAVWHHLQKLAAQGFVFEATRTRGYRLVRPPDGPHPALISAHLGRARALPFVCLATVDSTNAEAERRLAAGAEAPLAILAREQTQGRGRRGRPWHSAPNGNLYATFVFRPRTEPGRLPHFTLWMGLQVCELIAAFCRLQPGLKWPNDVHLGGRKAGGMLTEARVDADEVRDLVFGLGLNLNGGAGTLPPELRATATSLADATGGPVDLNRFAAALLLRVAQAYRSFADGSYRQELAGLWARYDVLRGRPVAVVQGTRTVRGTAEGIDAEGSLLVRTGAGTVERFRAGEVTLSREPA